MAVGQNIKRNLEIGTIYIPLWHTGLYTQRNPLFTPISAMGIQIISRYDTLWSGLNMELSLSNTMVRRPGFPTYCSQPFSPAQFPLTFYSFKDLSGNLYPVVDTQSNIYVFSPTLLSNLFTKSAGAGQTSFQKVGNTLYMADGQDFIQSLSGLSSPIAVGIGVPTQSLQVYHGTGSLLPTAGWSYGYSYANSNTGAVSTMSPATNTTGNLDISTVTEQSVTCPVTSLNSNGSPTPVNNACIATVGCANNFSAGQLVRLSGFSSPNSSINTYYVILSATSAQFTISTAPWGDNGPGSFSWWSVLSLTNLSGPTAIVSPITIPASVGSYSYTVVNSGAQFLPANLFGGTTPATVKGSTLSSSTSTGTILGLLEDANNVVYASVNGGNWATGGTITFPSVPGSFSWLSGITATVSGTSPINYGTTAGAGHYWVIFTDPTSHGLNTPVYPSGITVTSKVYNNTSASIAFTSVINAAAVTSTNKFYVDTNGDFLFFSGDAGRAITVTYDVTPAGGAPTVSFIVNGFSSNYPPQAQTDNTGWSTCDNLVVYRTNDGDAAGGPWFYLATIPNNIPLVSVTLNGSHATYNFQTPVPAGGNNGFAGAAGTNGAIISGFTALNQEGQRVNNGTFTIIASTTTSITVINAGATPESDVVGYVNQSIWTYTDTGSTFAYSFVPTNQDGELNILIEAPINDENDPPPNTTNPLTPSVDGTFSLLCYNAGRLWGAVDNTVYFAGGPDVTFGSPEDSWPPANVFTFPGKITAMVSVNAGLLVFTDSDMFIIYGTSTATFYSNMYQRNFGVASQNCVAQDGDNLFVYTTKRQLFCFTSSLQEIGFNIGDQLKANFIPSSTYLAIHRNGSDAGLFISDGSTNMYKYRLDQQSWSTVTQVVGGAGAISSIETTADNYTLLTGRNSGSQNILVRDETETIFQDAGAAYPAYAVVGTLTLSPPGNVSILESVLLQSMPIGTGAIVSVLLNEVAGTFTVLPNPVPDPPLLVPSTSILSSRYYLRAATTPLPQQVRHLMIKVAFATEDYRNEILTLGLS